MESVNQRLLQTPASLAEEEKEDVPALQRAAGRFGGESFDSFGDEESKGLEAPHGDMACRGRERFLLNNMVLGINQNNGEDGDLILLQNPGSDAGRVSVRMLPALRRPIDNAAGNDDARPQAGRPVLGELTGLPRELLRPLALVTGTANLYYGTSRMINEEDPSFLASVQTVCHLAIGSGVLMAVCSQYLEQLIDGLARRMMR
jgi:hypothetical protein